MRKSLLLFLVLFFSLVSSVVSQQEVLTESTPCQEIKKMFIELRQAVIRKDKKAFSESIILLNPKLFEDGQSPYLPWVNEMFEYPEMALETIDLFISQSSKCLPMKLDSRIFNSETGSNTTAEETMEMATLLAQAVKMAYNYDISIDNDDLYYIPMDICLTSPSNHKNSSVKRESPIAILVKVKNKWLKYTIFGRKQVYLDMKKKCN